MLSIWMSPLPSGPPEICSFPTNKILPTKFSAINAHCRFAHSFEAAGDGRPARQAAALYWRPTLRTTMRGHFKPTRKFAALCYSFLYITMGNVHRRGGTSKALVFRECNNQANGEVPLWPSAKSTPVKTIFTRYHHYPQLLSLTWFRTTCKRYLFNISFDTKIKL